MSVKALISGLKNTIALDFFHSPDGDMIFWTDVVDDKIYRGSMISGCEFDSKTIYKRDKRGEGF